MVPDEVGAGLPARCSAITGLRRGDWGARRGWVPAAGRGTQEAQRGTHSLLERAVGNGFVAVDGGPTGLVGAEAKLSQPGNDVQLLGTFCRGPCPLARLGFLARRRRACGGSRPARLFPCPPSLLPLVAHEPGAEGALRFELVELNRCAVDHFPLTR